jgi:hypothetical protein
MKGTTSYHLGMCIYIGLPCRDDHDIMVNGGLASKYMTEAIGSTCDHRACPLQEEAHWQ